MLRGEYDVNEVFVGVPCILGRDGVKEVMTLHLTPEEEKKFQDSCKLLNKVWKDSCLADEK